MNEIDNINLLKKLASQAEKQANQENKNENYAVAYRLIAKGANLLWRLLDSEGGKEKPELKS